MASSALPHEGYTSYDTEPEWFEKAPDYGTKYRPQPEGDDDADDVTVVDDDDVNDDDDDEDEDPGTIA